jgi:hypothetical protein
LKQILTVTLLIVLTACSTKQTDSNNNSSSKPTQSNQQNAPSPQAAKSPADLKDGEATGTIIDEGETVNLKFAYAGHCKQFDEDAVSVLVTDVPVSPDALAKAFEEYGMFPSGVRGLQYKVGKGFWVMYHPSGFQTSGINTLKDYSVENGMVKGRDDDSTDFNGKVYKRSVSFIARLPEKHS